jgi:thiol:disulfide interchange protein DsbA
MKQVLILLLSLLLVTACGQKEEPQAPVDEQSVVETEATEPATDDPVEEEPAGETLEVVEESAAVEEEPADEAIVLAMADTTPTPAREWKYTEGQHYFRLMPTQRTLGGADKIEVAEIFEYACPHCNQLDPLVSQWAEGLDPDVRFVRIPAIFNRVDQAHAKIYYTAEMLVSSGASLDLELFHKTMFIEYHQKRNRLVSEDSARKLFARFGISDEEFDKAWKSFPVDQKMRIAADLVRRYGITAVPAFVVNGKYRVPNSQAVFDIIDELLEREGLN